MPAFISLPAISVREHAGTDKFYEGTSLQFAWDSTSLAAFASCPRKYYFSLIRNLVTRDEAEALTLGICFHSAMETFYSIAKSDGFTAGLHAAVRVGLSYLYDAEKNTYFDSIDPARSRSNLVAAIIAYADFFEAQPHYLTAVFGDRIACETSFNFHLPFGPAGKQAYLYCGHFDRLAIGGGDVLYCFDYKTTVKQLSSYFTRNYAYSIQMLGYHLALFKIADRLKNSNNPVAVGGVILEAIRLQQMPDIQRMLLPHTRQDVLNFLSDLHAILAHAETCAANNYWPRNPTACGYCQFRPICYTPSQTEFEHTLRANFTNFEWNPLHARN